MAAKNTMQLYYLRKSGRITGPFPLMKLNLMCHNGYLTGEEMYSEDKIHWHYIDQLFPSLSPGQPVACRDIPTVNPPLSGKAETLSDKAPAARRLVLPEEEVRRPPLLEFLLDTGRTMALLWNFQEILREHEKKSTTFYCISLGINICIALVAVLLMGKFYSTGFHYFFSPLMALSLILLLFAVCSLFGWLCTGESKTSAAEKKKTKLWQMCASGIFMNYGTMTCCVLALYHALEQHLWVLLFLLFIDSFILCSTSTLLRDYAEHQKKSWKGTFFISVLFWNPAILAVIYYFIKLI